MNENNEKKSEVKNTPAAAPAPAPITKASLQAMLTARAAKLGMNDGSCSGLNYGRLLVCALRDFGALPAANVATALAVWDLFPKSPSAMRQALFERSGTSEANPVSMEGMD